MNHIVVRNAVVASALAIVAGTGCSDSVGPDGFAGRYDLDRYEGQALPAIALETSAGRSIVVAERITLGDNGTGLIERTLRTVQYQPSIDETFPVRSVVTFKVVADRIEITYVCPPNADCIAGPHLVGERSGNSLVLAWPPSSKSASVYKRVH